MKKILFLLLCTVSIYGQTYQNPTFGTVTTKTAPLNTTSDFITTTSSTGVQGKILGENISLSVIPPVTHFTPVTPNIKGYFQGVDNALGDIVATTAGITTRLWLTADQTTITAGTFYKTNFTNKGVIASAEQSVINDDNQKKYFTQDIIGDAYVAITTFPKGIYAGNLSVSASPNSAQQRFTVEVYKCNNAGTPIASGISGAVTGDLGVTVITILDSGLLTLADGSVTNVPVSNTIEFPFTINVGERVRYHISAEKVGTAASNITEKLYLGTSYNSYIDVPVPLNTSAVQNLSTVAGATTTDALNNLNAAIPVNYSKIVYVNNNNPNSATIFDLNNPPTVNDNGLKTDVNNLYIGLDASGWVYNSTSLTYVTKTVTSATSNFYLSGTTTDAGNTKTAPIQRTGSISIGGNSSQIGVKIEAFSTQKTAAINAFTNFTPDVGVTMPQGIAMGSNDIEGVVNTGYALMGYNVNSSSSLCVMSQVAQNSDVGNIPLTLIQSNRLGNSGVTSAIVVNRPILGISNFNQRLITVLPSGNTGFGKDIPSEKIDVIGAVKISGTSSGGMLKFEHPTAISTNVTGQLTGGTTGENVGGVMSFVRGTATGRGSIVFDTRGSGYNANALVIREDGSISNAALTGTGTRQVVASSTGILSAGSAQPLEYVALITQSGTNAPVATVLKNTLGGTIVWTRALAGVYTGTLAGAFTTSKTVIQAYLARGSGQPTTSVGASPGGSINTVQLVSWNASNVSADTIFSADSWVKIEVYP